MHLEPRYSHKQALRILARAAAVPHGAGEGPSLDELVDAGACVGIPRESVIQAASLEHNSRLAAAIVLGKSSSFHLRLPLTRPISGRELVDAIEASGYHGGRTREQQSSFVWHKRSKHQWVRISIASGDDMAVYIAAQRSISIAWIQWLGPGAGVLAMGWAYSAFTANASAPPVAVLMTAAVFGFAIARAAWGRIVDAWQSDIADFAADLQTSLQTHREETAR